MTGHARPRDYSGWYLVLIAVGSVAVVVGLAFWYYRGQREQVLARAGEGLRMVAELKVSQVQRWREERISDGEWLRDAMSVAWIKAFIAAPEDPARRADAEQWLGLLQSHHRARRVHLFDANRRLLLARPAADFALAGYIAADLDAVLGNRAVRLSDLERVAGSKTVFQALVVPISDRVNPGGARRCSVASSWNSIRRSSFIR